MTGLIIQLIINNRRRNNQRNKLRLLRRTLRDGQNPFEVTTDEHFIKLYKFPKHLCMDLIKQLKPFLNLNQRKNALPSHIKVLSALRFFATGRIQRAVGDDSLSSLSQTSVSRSVTEISMALNRIAHRYVNFPAKEEFPAIKAKFYEKYGFPNVIGLVNGTHIKVKPSNREIEHDLFSTNRGYLINVQIVCGADLIIFSANAQYGGTAKNAYVWHRSRVKSTLEEMYNKGEQNFWLLGDSGYPLQPWLMTPIPTASTVAETRYNETHDQTREIVDRCICVLKSRFRCLSNERVLFYCPAKAGIIINACIVLHNALIKAKIPFLEEEELKNDYEAELNDEDDPNCTSTETLQEGIHTRSRLVDQAFGQDLFSHEICESYNNKKRKLNK